jgi:hypothetical protein
MVIVLLVGYPDDANWRAASSGTIDPSVSLLNSQFSLLDIRDVESFTGRIVERSNLHLDHSDREDLHAFLVAECWLLSTRYSPGGISFSSLAGATLRLRVVDWQRQRFGRTRWTFKNGREHVRERPKRVSLDADDSLRDRLDESVAARSGDPSADSRTDLEWLLEGGDREAARDIAAMGLSPYG